MAVLSDTTSLLADRARLWTMLVRISAVMLLVMLPATVFALLPAGDGRSDMLGSVFGHDFSGFWIAGRMIAEGQPAAIYDFDAHQARQIAAFGRPDQLLAWHYPPPFMLLADGLAQLPMGLALTLWTAGSLLAITLVLRQVNPRWDVLLVALATPVILRNVGYAQNGLLTATLMTSGVLLLGRRPALAGLCFGLLCYKPQLGLIIPFALLASRSWTALASAAATVAALLAVTTALYGVAIWPAFLASLPTTNAMILGQAVSGLDLNMSAFGAVRLLGGPSSLAWAVQACVAAVTIAVVAMAFHRGGASRASGALLLAGTALVSPYVPDYDQAVLVPAAVLGLVAALEERDGVSARHLLLVAAAAVACFAPRAAATALHVPAGFLGAVLLVVVLADLALRSGQSASDAITEPARA